MSSSSTTMIKKGFDTKQCDLKNSNLPDNEYDTIICIAALHHLMDNENQMNALFDMKRILKDDGKLLISVWHPESNFINKEIEKHKFQFLDLKMKKVKVTYTLEDKKFDRFYYLFTKDEFTSICSDAGFKIEETKIEKGNLYLTLSKK